MRPGGSAAGDDHVFDTTCLTFRHFDDGKREKESSAAMAKANLGQRRHGAGGETGRVGCGGRR